MLDTVPQLPRSEPGRRARRGLVDRFNLEIREHMPLPQQLLIMLGGVVVGLAISSLLLVAAGVSLPDVLDEFVVEIFTSSRNLSSVLVYASTLVIVGLSAAIAFKARFWNIGIEGQIIFGGIGATLVANYDIGPPELRLVVMALFAVVFGMAWMLLPAVLKLRLQINEIISTLLMNYIAFNFLLHLLYGPWKDPATGFPSSKLYDSFEQLPLLGWHDLNLSTVFAVVLVAGSAWLLGASRFGFLLRFVHSNPRMARAMGVRIGVFTLAAALTSAGLAGFGGFVISAGIAGRLTQSFFVGYGFSGILIGFLARNNPVGVVIFSLLISIMMVAGQALQVFYQIPFAMVELMQAIIVICVAASEFFIRHRLRLVA